MANSKLDKLNAMLEKGVTDDLDLDFDEEEQEEVVKPAKPVKQEKPVVEEEKFVLPPKRDKPFISDTFDNLMEGVKAKQEPKVSSIESVSAAEILSNIKVDLSNIQLSTGFTESDLNRTKVEVLGSNKVMQVVCCQSAYSAELSALRNQEIQNINNTNADLYTFKKRLYKAIWDHIENTSVGKMDFNTWMKVTSFFDIETLLYGIYCMTFPHQNKYPMQCPARDCQQGFDIVVDNNTLIETRGDQENIYAKIDEVITNIKKSSELVANSHVHTTQRIILNESKIIVDIQIPSVYDYLEGILGKVRHNEDYAEENANSLGLAMFIKQFLIPDLDNLRRTGTLTYIPITDSSKFVELIASLSYFDGELLSEEVEKFSTKLHITYSIKGVKCPKCGYEYPEIPLEMERVLFTAIRLGRRG